MRGLFGVVGGLACVLAICCGMATTASALPAERHYEMVSPVFKGGFGAGPIEAVAPDGEAAAFKSAGSYAGAPGGLNALSYLARRGPTGWSTVSLVLPASNWPATKAYDISPSLDLVFRLGVPGPNSESRLKQVDVLLHPTNTPDASGWEQDGVLKPVTELTPNPEPVESGASPDFCHLLFSVSEPEALLPEAIGVEGAHQLYQFDRGCNGEPAAVTLVGLNNKDKLIYPNCDVVVGNEEYLPPTYGHNGSFNTINADGSEVFFTVCLHRPPGGGSISSDFPHQLFVRLGSTRTLEISRPLGGCVAGGVPGEVPCDGALERPSADFAGASEDGSTVYFTTTAPLTSEDKDSGIDLYVARIGCPAAKPACSVAEREVTSLAQVSHDPVPGQAAGVQGVVRVAPDGTRAYFVAGGDLLPRAREEALEGEGRPVPHAGAANLYVYDSASGGSVAFVGDLCSGAELSGTVADVYCPSATSSDEHLWVGAPKEVEAQTGGVDGRFLVFASFAQLLASDANRAKDVYRYDAVTGRLERISGGEAGYDSNGNLTVFNHENENGEVLGANIHSGHYGGSEYVRNQHELDSRAISEDGSRIVFSSAEPLSPTASNGLENAYEWHESPGAGEGTVSLISSGGSVEPVKDVVISPNGLSVFFETVEGLVPQDTDGAPDIYDARLEGGFPPRPAERRPCEGDACQGPLTNPAPLLVPGSVSQAPGGNFAAPKQAAKPKRKVKRRKKPKPRKARAKKARRTAGRRGAAGNAVGGSGR